MLYQKSDAPLEGGVLLQASYTSYIVITNYIFNVFFYYF